MDKLKPTHQKIINRLAERGTQGMFTQPYDLIDLAQFQTVNQAIGELLEANLIEEFTNGNFVYVRITSEGLQWQK